MPTDLSLHVVAYSKESKDVFRQTVHTLMKYVDVQTNLSLRLVHMS